MDESEDYEDYSRKGYLLPDTYGRKPDSGYRGPRPSLDDYDLRSPQHDYL